MTVRIVGILSLHDYDQIRRRINLIPGRFNKRERGRVTSSEAERKRNETQRVSSGRSRNRPTRKRNRELSLYLPNARRLLHLRRREETSAGPCFVPDTSAKWLLQRRVGDRKLSLPHSRALPLRRDFLRGTASNERGIEYREKERIIESEKKEREERHIRRDVTASRGGRRNP